MISDMALYLLSISDPRNLSTGTTRVGTIPRDESSINAKIVLKEGSYTLPADFEVG